ncbi:MAG: class I SAM-dependent methyltransferase [Phycisphaerae bacterium]|jgi:SAM-dependent methyltransferase
MTVVDSSAARTTSKHVAQMLESKPVAKRAAKARTKTGKGTRAAGPITRDNTEKLWLYIWSVQCPEAEIDFVTDRFKKLTGRPLRRLREDFCGAAATSAYFVQQHAENVAIGVDLHKPTLTWGLKNLAKDFTNEQRERLVLLHKNVLDPGPQARSVDAVLAMNFSYWIFQERETMLQYFRSVKKSLKSDGVFFMDIHGGYETTKEQQEPRWIKAPDGRRFRYIWDQNKFNPVTSETQCFIHFEFEKGPALQKAFSYTWRVWTVREIRELLLEAGFKHATFYGENEDEKGKGNGVYTPKTRYDADASFIAYLSAHG